MFFQINTLADSFYHCIVQFESFPIFYIAKIFRLCNNNENIREIFNATINDKFTNILCGLSFFLCADLLKAANIKKCCRQLADEYGGEVPDSIDAMTELAGTGRKTANLVMGEWFGAPAYVIDTHVKRIWALLGISGSTTPEAIEKDLRVLIPPEDPKSGDALALSHLLITHGRAVCVAGRPDCQACPISSHCAHFNGGQA